MADLSRYNKFNKMKSKRVQHNEVIHRKILETQLEYMEKLNMLVAETLGFPEIPVKTKALIGMSLGTLYQYKETIHPREYYDREDRYNKKDRLSIYRIFYEETKGVWKHLSDVYNEGNEVLYKIGKKLKMIEGEKNPYIGGDFDFSIKDGDRK